MLGFVLVTQTLKPKLWKLEKSEEKIVPWIETCNHFYQNESRQGESSVCPFPIEVIPLSFLFFLFSTFNSLILLFLQKFFSQVEKIWITRKSESGTKNPYCSRPKAKRICYATVLLPSWCRCISGSQVKVGYINSQGSIRPSKGSINNHGVEWGSLNVQD